MRRFSKKEILSAIKISDIAISQGISLIEASSGNFTHMCKCPAEDHKSGLERTGSLYIDNDNNNFYCFGCGSSNNAIDFYMICTGKNFSEAMTDLSEIVDPAKVSKGATAREQSNFYILLEISSLIRTTQKRHPNDLVWIGSLIKKMDLKLSLLGRNDVAGAIKVQERLKDILNRRYPNV
jgi:DNA primase